MELKKTALNKKESNQMSQEYFRKRRIIVESDVMIYVVLEEKLTRKY